MTLTLQPGKTYRAKRPRVIRNLDHPCCGARNDRTIVRIAGGYVFFSSPAVVDARPSRMTLKAFLDWADSATD